MLFIVDDTADYRFLVQYLFAKYLPDYSVRLFVNGAQLIHYTEIRKDNEPLPRLILLDVDMPYPDGFQTLTQLKQLEDWQDVPVIMMSNRTEKFYEEEAYRRGAHNFLVKPVDFNALRETMEELCHNWSTARNV